MCITTECRIDNAAGTATETVNELRKSLETASPVESMVIAGIMADAVSVVERLESLHRVLRAQG